MDNPANTLDRETPFYVGDWLVEPATGRLIHGDEESRLEPRAMDVLICLAGRPAEVISREELESIVWAGMVVGYDSLASAIIKLRKALGDDSRNPSYVETVSKRGYRLIAAVRPATTEPASIAPESTVPESTVQDSPVSEPEIPATRSNSRLVIGVLAAAVALLLVYGFMQVTEDPAPGQAVSPSPAPAATEPSLVVLPFVNSNDDPGQEYFSEGITHDLISDLSQYSGLQVIARRTAYIYKDSRVDIQTIASELGVDYVLDGNIRRDGNRVRMNVQLIDAAAGTNIWAQRFDRETRDIFALQDDIREKIINALSVTLSNEDKRREQARYTASFDAYDLFLQGQAKLVTRASAEDNREAQRLLEQAIALDPNFSRAYAALALSHAEDYRLIWTEDPERTRQQALDLGLQAMDLNPNSYQAAWILGFIYLFLYEDHEQALVYRACLFEL